MVEKDYNEGRGPGKGFYDDAIIALNKFFEVPHPKDDITNFIERGDPKFGCTKDTEFYNRYPKALKLEKLSHGAEIVLKLRKAFNGSIKSLDEALSLSEALLYEDESKQDVAKIINDISVNVLGVDNHNICPRIDDIQL